MEHVNPGDAAASNGDTVTWREMLARVSEWTGDRTIARWMCEHASGCDRDEFALLADTLVPARCGLHLEDMVRRHRAGEPLQYVMGRWAFRHLDLMVDRRVLIPRPETEMLVDMVLGFLHSRDADGAAHCVADLGTGSGAVGLSILAETPPESCVVWMTDVSDDALAVATANAAGLGRLGAGARFGCGAWFDALPTELCGRFDAIVSNPPYIAAGDSRVESVVHGWEPHVALYSVGDGLEAIRHIVSGAPRWLAPGGLLAVEIGSGQGTAVAREMSAAGLVEVRIEQDLSGHDRYARAILPR